ncbi:hypothetical protein CJU89_5025 [Yarrowia sp. B02]|nr:hypothetical protein CJU89_5025 [Yarrowia sp. B02]
MEAVSFSHELDDNLVMFKELSGGYIAVEVGGDSWRYSETKATPVACYNGLVWWIVNGKTLVPTYADFHTGKVYYSADLAFTGFYKQKFNTDLFGTNPLFDQGSKSCKCRQFLVDAAPREGEPLAVYDLATGVITVVAFPAGCSPGLIKLGFVDGKFQPHCLSSETCARYDKVLEEVAKEGRVVEPWQGRLH